MDVAQDDRPRYLGKYRLERLLGKGGMGEVYAAHDTTLDRVVALKTIRSGSDDQQHTERFRREGRAAARLRHPLIVTVFELGDVNGTLFLAMEYLDGESLGSALRAGRLPLEQKMAILTLVLEGLQHAHEQGVVHRDVKPANVQILADGSVKILDFGIARLVAGESLSHTGMVLGTVPYMSPEQLRGERVDHRTDIYAVGVLGYEMFTGRRPFDGDTLTEIVLKVINDPLPPMSGEWTGRFPGLDQVLARALEKAAADRYSSAAEMAAELRAVETGSRPPAVLPASTTYRVPRPLPTAADPPAERKAPRPAAWRKRALGLGVGAATVAAALIARESAPRPGVPVPSSAITAEGGSSAPPPAAVAPAPPAQGPALPSPSIAASIVARPALGGDDALVRALHGALRGRATRWRAGDRIDARIAISLRKAPFAASSAVTADYTARATVLSGGRAPVRCELSGHALEFGEAAARAAAVARAAEELADCLARR